MLNTTKVMNIILMGVFLVVLGAKSGMASGDCPYDFKVYVYDIPADIGPVKLAEEARSKKQYHVCQKCIMEQFALEYIIVDFFTNFCGRTLNPKVTYPLPVNPHPVPRQPTPHPRHHATTPQEADFFYLPIVRDVEYRAALYSSEKGNKRAPSRMDTVLLEAMENGNTQPWRDYLNVTDEYWKRHGGADHIVVMPAPVTNLRHQVSAAVSHHASTPPVPLLHSSLASL